MNQQEIQTILAQVIAKAWIDVGFKEQLKKDPRAVLSKMGIDLSPKINMTVVEDSETQWHLYLPPSPASMGEEVVTVTPMSPGGSSSSGQCCKCVEPCA